MKPSRLLESVSLPLLGLDWAPIPEGSGQAETRAWDHEANGRCFMVTG